MKSKQNEEISVSDFYLKKEEEKKIVKYSTSIYI